MFKINEVMTRGVFTLQPSCSIEEAVSALVNRGVGGAPVLAEDGSIVGVVSKSDLLRSVAGTSGVDAGQSTVGEVMTPAVVAVAGGDSLADAIGLMVAHAVHRVFVVDDTGAPVGVVTALDVLRRMVERAGHRQGVTERTAQAIA